MPERAIDFSHTSAPQPVPASERKLDFETQLREGYYTNIKLEGYMAENIWRREIVARDVLQNFFDANGQTLDGVYIDVEEKTDTTIVTIHADQSYPYQRVVSFGSGYKDKASRAAGGKHQGSKDVVVMLLREYGCEAIEYESENWRLEFYKKDLPEVLKEEKSGQKEHGVFLKLRDREHQEGNLLRFETRDKEMAKEMVKARDLFFHENNHDLRHPDIDTEKGGFRLLPDGQKGNFYLNGQRICVNERAEWNTVPRFTFWSKETPQKRGERIELSRDRDLITLGDILFTYIPFLIESMSLEEQQLTLMLLSDFYEGEADTSKTIGQEMVRQCIRGLAKQGEQISLHPSFLANDLVENKSMVEAIKQKGYRLCMPEFSKIGMKKASEILSRLEQNDVVELNEGERKRSELLQNMIGDFLLKAKRLRLSPKPIQPFAGGHPLEGQYDTNFVWMNRRTLTRNEPSKTIATYLHELSHAFGSDQSATFSYKLTDVLADWTRYVLEYPHILPEFGRAWSEIDVSSRLTTQAEIMTTARSFIDQFEMTLGASSPEQFQNDDRRMNAMAERLLDLMSDRFPEPFTFEHVMQVWAQIQMDPLAIRIRKIDASFETSPEEQARLEDELKNKRIELSQARQRIIFLHKEIEHFEKKRFAKKHRPSQKEKASRAKLAYWNVKEEELSLEHRALKDALPNGRDFVDPKESVHVFDHAFPVYDAINPTVFFIAAARTLHASLPPGMQIDETAEKATSHIRSCYQAVQKFNQKDDQNRRWSFSIRTLTHELELFLPLLLQNPSAQNIQVGELLCAELEQLYEKSHN